MEDVGLQETHDNLTQRLEESTQVPWGKCQGHHPLFILSTLTFNLNVTAFTTGTYPYLTWAALSLSLPLSVQEWHDGSRWFFFLGKHKQWVQKGTEEGLPWPLNDSKHCYWRLLSTLSVPKVSLSIQITRTDEEKKHHMDSICQRESKKKDKLYHTIQHILLRSVKHQYRTCCQ